MKIATFILCTLVTLSAFAMPNTTVKAKPEGVIGLDVRTVEEVKADPSPGAINIPVDDLKTQAEIKLTDKNAKILIFCRSGRRSKIGKATLEELGYKNVTDIGTWKDWNNLKR